MSWARPVRPAPEASVIRRTVRLAPPAAAALTRPAVCEAETNDLAACLARVAARESLMNTVLSLLGGSRHHRLVRLAGRATAPWTAPVRARPATALRPH